MGGGGGGNNMAMMMMMQQQQASADARAAAESKAQREYQAQQDAYNHQRQTEQDAIAQQRYEQTRSDTSAQTAAQQQKELAAAQLAEKQRQEDYDHQQQSAAQQRQQAIDDRNYQQSLVDQQRQRDDAAAAKVASDAAAAKQADADKLTAWRGNRDAVASQYKNDATGRLQSLGVSDPSVSAALMSALNSAGAAIPDSATNVNSYFDGVIDKVLGQQTDAARTRYSGQLNSLLPTDFQNTKVADNVDDSILEAILGDQYNSAAADAKRLLDRGVITQEGYDANLKGLDTQRNTGRAKLTTLGNNELNSERTKLGNIANTGRGLASQYQLGQSFDPNKYVTDVNSDYDNWFAGLGDKLKGVAPSDLFDTSSFLNTAGRVTGATNSPFVGTTNALTGSNALSDEDNKKKQSASTASSIGVF